MALTPGTKLGPYEIQSRLGAGGMGEVYRARDTRLDRTVAVKVLPSHLSSDPDLKQRFEREARVISSLNHPNICTLYDVGHQNGTDYLVMEFLEGETLADRLVRGPLPPEQVLKYGAEICKGLEKAHKTGVIHRDLKPGNVMLTKTCAKLMDFGLAKATIASVPPVSSLCATASGPSREPPLTTPGTVLGTFQYMSPEQLEGKEADALSDVFALGAMLYEMATGKRAFTGKTQASLVAAILASEPEPISVLQPMSPLALDRVVKVCLAKDPDERFQNVRDVELQLKWIAESGSPARVSAPVAARRRLSQKVLSENMAWSVAALLAITLGPVAFLHFREKPPALAAPVCFQVPAPENTMLGPFLRISPDGRKLAFVAGTQLWVHFLESGESRDLTAADQNSPFWSPDSRFIGYVSQDKLKKIGATGGSPQTVSDLPGTWAAGTWNQDDVIVFGSPSGLFRVPASGGVPVQITRVDPSRQESSHAYPAFLPDGQHFIYFRRSTQTENNGIYLGSVDALPEQQSSKFLFANRWGAAKYAPSDDPGTGYLLFIREGALMAQPFDNRRLELKGQATPVAEQVDSGFGAYGAFSASANDVLAYWRGSAVLDRQLTWYDREGKVLGTVGEPGDYQWLALSPDGARVALRKTSGQLSNIWLLDLSRDTSTRFTFGSARDSSPVWSPDGSRITFSSGNDLYLKPANGVQDAELLQKVGELVFPGSWSSNGQFLLYEVLDPKTKWDIWVLPLAGDKKPVPFVVTEFNQGAPRFSPDSHWVAYMSDESGHYEIYVRSFAMNSSGTAVQAGGRWQISDGYGEQPRWRSDGRELYYLAEDGKVMAVEIATNPEFRPGKPQPLGLSAGRPSQAEWDNAADGGRFLIAAPKGNKPESYTVVLNWQASLKK